MAAAVVGSSLRSVTVHRVGAVVTRVAEVAAGDDGAWPAEVRVAGLPLCLDDGSVRVRLTAPDGADAPPPVATGVRVALEVPPPDPSLAPPRDEELEAARREETELGLRRVALVRAQERLGSLEVRERAPGEEGAPPRPTPLEARRALVELRTRELARVQEELRALDGRIREAQRRRADLEDRFQRATTARQARECELRKCAVVTVRAEPGSAPRATLELEYAVPGARWAPTYAVRFDRAFAGARLDLRAQVAQRTGEDWTGVELTLSTADARAWTELPELASLRIGRAQPRPPRAGWRPAPVGADELFADYDRGFRAPSAASEAKPTPKGGLAGDDWSKDAAPCAPCSESVAVPCSMAPPPPPCAPCPAPGGAPTGGATANVARFASRAVAAPSPKAKRRAAPVAAQASTLAGGGAGLDGFMKSAMPSMAVDLCEREESAAPCCEPAPEAPAPEAPAELTAGRDLLDYGRLRMAPPGASGRGRLGPVAPRESYMEMLVATRVAVAFDVMAVVARAGADARAVAAEAPPRCSLPEPFEGFDHAFLSEARVDVPSDGEYHSVPLVGRDAAVALRYVVVPRESRDAFRVAAFTNPLDAPLLPGPVDVSVGPDFLMTCSLAAVPPKGEAELGLGVEQGVKVARRTAFAERTSGLLGGQLALRHEVVVDVENLVGRPARVEVRERVPRFPENDTDNRVAVVEASPPWEPFEQRERPLRSGWRWLVTVPPGEKRTLKAAYEVQIASKHELAGGNRREE